ncbi:hypothetical protein SAMN05421878_10912 [Actinobaculum suis]|nr:hypothetical protein SAMN05421878_10912 [Actinobaculum suis]
MEAQSTAPEARFADIRGSKLYNYVGIFFVSFLLISNIGATKLIGIHIGPLNLDLVFDGGAILFPLTYIIGDLLSEVYGFKAAARTIVLGFGIQILASFCFWLVQIAPPAAEYVNQEAYEAVLGVVPRFVAASVCGFLFGQLMNSYVLVWIKQKFGEKRMWVRLISSTIVGELVDTIIFCFIAWGAEILAGNLSFATILNLTLTGWIYKILVEVVLLPVTYAVVGRVKRVEGIA